MNRTRPNWAKITEQLIHVAAAVVQTLNRLGLPPPRSDATGIPRLAVSFRRPASGTRLAHP
jgi:hypothetical protein